MSFTLIFCSAKLPKRTCYAKLIILLIIICFIIYLFIFLLLSSHYILAKMLYVCYIHHETISPLSQCLYHS